MHVCHGSMCLADIKNFPGDDTSLDKTRYPELAQEVARRPCFCPGYAPSELVTITDDIALSLCPSSISGVAVAAPRVSVRPHESLHAKCLSGAWHPGAPRLAPDHLLVDGSLKHQWCWRSLLVAQTTGSRSVGRAHHLCLLYGLGHRGSAKGVTAHHHRGPHRGRTETLKPPICFEPQGLNLWNGAMSSASEGHVCAEPGQAVGAP